MKFCGVVTAWKLDFGGCQILLRILFVIQDISLGDRAWNETLQWLRKLRTYFEELLLRMKRDPRTNI